MKLHTIVYCSDGYVEVTAKALLECFQSLINVLECSPVFSASFPNPMLFCTISYYELYWQTQRPVT